MGLFGFEADEETYLSGLLLDEALFSFSNPETVRNYRSLINAQPDPVKAENTGTLLGALQSINENLQNSQEVIRKKREALENVYREILNLVKNRQVTPYRVSIAPPVVGLPYREFQFTGVRLLRESLKEEKSNDEIIPVKNGTTQNQNSLRTSPLRGNRKSVKSFSELDPELYIRMRKGPPNIWGYLRAHCKGIVSKAVGQSFSKFRTRLYAIKLPTSSNGSKTEKEKIRLMNRMK